MSSIWIGQQHEKNLRNDLLKQASAAAQALDVGTIQALTGTPDDLQNPRYAILKQQLSAARRIYPNVRFLYLMGLRDDGTVFFYIDSEAPGSPDESPPGQLYTDATQPLLETFTSQTMVVEGPSEDAWGTWVSALIPLTDSVTGDTVAVFGMDVDAKDWRSQIAGTTSTPIVQTALLILAIWGVLALQWIRGKTPESDRASRWFRYTPVLFAGLLGGGLTFILIWYGTYFEQVSRKETFERLAFARAGLIASALHQIEYPNLEGLSNLFTASDYVTRQEFADYSQPLTKNQLTTSWAWVPRVESKDRAAFEEAAQKDGNGEYRIWESDPQGNAIPARGRDFYYPIRYIAPAISPNASLGYDLASEPVRRAALEKAQETGLIIATDPIQFVDKQDAKKGLALYKPIPARKNPGMQSGFVTAIIQAERLMQVAEGTGSFRELSLYVDFLQLYPDQNAFLLASTMPEEWSQYHLESALPHPPGVEFTYMQPIFVYGKAYAIVAHPSSTFARIYPRRSALNVALSGGMLTLFIMVLVGLYTNRNYNLTRLVKIRTEELQESERKFQIALKNSPVTVFQQDRDLRYVWIHNPHPVFDQISLIGKTDSDMTSANDAARMTEIKRRVLDSGIGERHVVQITIQDEVCFYDLTVDPVFEDGTICGITCSSVNITDSKRREQEIIKRNKEMQLLYEASQQLSHSLQVDHIYSAFYALICDLMPCDALFIAHYNGTKKSITARYAALNGSPINPVDLQPLTLRPGEHGLVDTILRNKSSIVVRDTTTERQANPLSLWIRSDQAQTDTDPAAPESIPPQSFILIPLIFQNEVKGLVQIQCLQKNGFTEEDLRIAEALVSQIAAAIDNAMLFQQTLDEIETRKQAESKLSRLLNREESMVRLSQNLANSLNAQQICSIAADYLNQSLDISHLGISRVDESQKTIHVDFFINHGMQVDVSQFNTVHYPDHSMECQRAAAIFTRSVQMSNPFLPATSCLSAIFDIHNQEIAKAVIVPMIVEDQVTGLVELYSESADSFMNDDFEWLTMVANLIGLSLQNARSLAQATNRSENLMALHTIDMAISSGVDLRLTINILLEQVIKQLDVDAACVLLVNKHTNALQFYRGLGFRTRKNMQIEFAVSRTLAETVSNERKNIYIQDLNASAQFPGISNAAVDENFVSYYGVPLIAKGQVIGVLEVYRRSEMKPGKEWFDFVDILAGQSAIAIDTAEVFENLQRSNSDLIKAYDATIQGWSQALEFRDEETEGHTLRVTLLAVRFARKLGMPESEVLNVRRGALLHDIGKIGVPDSILHKPGPLTEGEWEVMRKHPQTAYDLLSRIEYLKDALSIPHDHHEKWDGSGYPRGLRGKEIPLAARLFAIIDVWDALLSDRPYRNAWPVAEVLAYLQQNCGTHFDPDLVPVFLELIQDN